MTSEMTAAVTQPLAEQTVLTSIEPIIPGFHPDPSVVRVGGDYYLANSSFEYFPAVPIHHSTDLITWKLIGHALHREDQFQPGHADSSKGIFAPTLRHHDGKFWLITTDVPRGGGHLVVSADNPIGPWSRTTTIAGLDGIDPDIAWDTDGTCYVTYCAVDNGVSAIAQARVDLHRGVILEKPRVIWRGTGLAFPEGPHLYRIGQWWYLVIAEGGTERGHAVSIARSASPEGPFVGSPGNPVLSHRSLTHPVQNVGHGDLVETPDGDWAMVYLGVRSSGHTPWYHVNGRETFLAGIDWIDDWPVIDETRYDRPIPDRSWSESFTAPRLDPRWITPGNGFARVSRDSGPGILLTPYAAHADPRDAIMVRPTGLRWTVRVVVEPHGGTLAVRLRMDDVHYCDVVVSDGTARASLHIGQIGAELGTALFTSGQKVTISVTAADSDTGPDDILVAVSTPKDGTTRLTRFDGRYLSTEVAGGFTGRTIGIYPIVGSTRLLRVDYEPLAISRSAPTTPTQPSERNV